MTENLSTPAPPRGNDPGGDAEEVVNQVFRFFRLMKRASARFASQHKDGIEQAAYHLLAVLVTEGAQRTTALAEAVHSDTSTVSRQVGALVRDGLVERQADPADGRACLLAATPEGGTCFAEHRAARTAQMAEVLQHWTSEDLHMVATLFERLNRDFERHDSLQTTGGLPHQGVATQQKGGIR